jgi:hypothetical protein
MFRVNEFCVGGKKVNLAIKTFETLEEAENYCKESNGQPGGNTYGIDPDDLKVKYPPNMTSCEIREALRTAYEMGETEQYLLDMLADMAMVCEEAQLVRSAMLASDYSEGDWIEHYIAG